MEKVTHRVSNPFGLDVPCREVGGRSPHVPGYGDPNGDFHLVGDHPGRHGGAATGIPFTGSAAGRALRRVLAAVGLAEGSETDRPVYTELYTSYRYPCLPAMDEPLPRDYDAVERYFDAELRAVNAHVLLPVGEEPVRRVLASYTSRGAKLSDVPLTRLHTAEIHGAGFLVIPVLDPGDWTRDDAEAIERTLDGVLSSDYRQTKGVATRYG